MKKLFYLAITIAFISCKVDEPQPKYTWIFEETITEFNEPLTKPYPIIRISQLIAFSLTEQEADASCKSLEKTKVLLNEKSKVYKTVKVTKTHL